MALEKSVKEHLDKVVGLKKAVVKVSEKVDMVRGYTVFEASYELAVEFGIDKEVLIDYILEYRGLK